MSVISNILKVSIAPTVRRMPGASAPCFFSSFTEGDEFINSDNTSTQFETHFWFDRKLRRLIGDEPVAVRKAREKLDTAE